MTEINTNLRTGQQQSQTQQQTLPQRQPRPRRSGNEPTIADANRLPGLASGLNTQNTINKILQVERRRLEPVEELRVSTLQELESFGLINENLETLKATVDSLRSAATPSGKARWWSPATRTW
ncbi:MAG: hypothetical protein GWO16_10795 [Gammaproteobacteria bacterium]|nr:hypothetical protein [Gammaproteobacteria bacterium]